MKLSRHSITQKSMFYVLSGTTALTLVGLGCDRQPAEPVTDIVIIRQGNSDAPLVPQGETLPKDETQNLPAAQRTAEPQPEVTTAPVASPKPVVEPVATPEPARIATAAPTPDATPVATPDATPSGSPADAETTYKLVPRDDGSTGIQFKIGYTLGTHKGVATSGAGSVVTRAAASELTLKKANFAVPIASLKSGNDLRDCHILESMGIKYEGSRYPGQHVCDGNNNVPATGPDSVSFPYIQFELANATITSANKVLVANSAVNLSANASWTMHGITKNSVIPLNVTMQSDGRIRVTGNTSFKIKDFDIIVKPFLGIGVKDIATVDLDLLFEK